MHNSPYFNRTPHTNNNSIQGGMIISKSAPLVKLDVFKINLLLLSMYLEVEFFMHTLTYIPS